MATGNLGGATFTVTANTQPFRRGMQQAQQQAQQASRAISSSINQGSRHASMGLLELSRAIEDAQYGFRSVVNNIPGIVTAFGGGAGLAGGISIAAVAVNQMIEHWDELKATFGDTSPFQVVQGALELATQAAKDHVEELKKVAGVLAPGATMIGQFALDQWQKHAPDREAAAAKARRDAETEKAKEAIEKFRTPEQKQQARDFNAALGIYGGPDKLMKDLVDAGTAPMQGKIAPEAMKALREKIAGDVAHAIGEAMQGKGVGDVLGKKMGMLMEGQAQGRIMQGFEAQGKQDAEARMKQDRLDEAEAREWRAGVDRAQKEINAGKKRQARQDAADARHGRHVRRQVRDILDATAPRERERDRAGFVGFAEMSKQIQAGALDQQKDIQMRQLKVLQRIADLIEDNPEMAAEIRKMAGMPAVAGGPN